MDEGLAAHGFCYANKKNGDVIFSSGSKVEGPIKYMSSYRAEMVSIIAAITLIDGILTCAGLKDVRICLYTDSATSILTSKNSKLNTLHYVLSNDVDVALQLYDTVSNCNKKIPSYMCSGTKIKTKPSMNLRYRPS